MVGCQVEARQKVGKKEKTTRKMKCDEWRRR